MKPDNQNQGSASDVSCWARDTISECFCSRKTRTWICHAERAACSYGLL